MKLQSIGLQLDFKVDYLGAVESSIGGGTCNMLHQETITLIQFIQ